MRRGVGPKPDAPRRPGRGSPGGLARAGLVGAALLGGGCLTTSPQDWVHNGFKVGPNYCRPPAPVAPDWIEGADPHVQKRQVDEWWNVFQDPQLNRLIETAYRQNLTLRDLGTRVLQARAQQAIAAGNIFPQVQQAQGQYSRVGLSHNTFNNPSAFSGLGLLPAGTPPPPLVGNFFSDWLAGFNLSWELDFWGRFRRAIESADANLDASVENYDAALVTLLADVATNYVQYRVAQQRIKIARENVRIQEAVLGLAEQRFRVGTTTRLDVEQARTILEQTRSTIPFLEITLGQANDRLCILLGLPPRDLGPDLGEGTPLGTDPMASVPDWVAAGVPADLLRRRPDVRSAERQVAAQSAQIGVAEADLYPTIFINGTLGVEAADLSKLFTSGSFFGTITPGFRWNILNYGRILNNVRLQEARTQELIAAYQNQVLTAAGEAQTSLRGFLRSREQADALGRSVTAAVAATRLGVDQYRTGTINFTPVFQLQTSQVTVQDQLAVAQGDIALNLINVYRALGGGWELRLRAGCAAPAAAPPAPPPAPAARGPEQRTVSRLLAGPW
jgi:NodT family efflux transporter outer membrane factor (OMF) lipoprotein